MRAPDMIADRFELLERAGVGGMGFVYKAKDNHTGQLAAVKLLHSEQGAERFLREAAMLSNLAHPAIVRYVAHGATESGRLYLAMEWLPGQSLSELLATRKLSVAETLTLARRVASGLAAAHQQGVVHRDVKPSNVLLPNGELGRAMLIDFGVARRRLDPRITQAGLLVGTIAYMSPEQAAGEGELGPSSDVFSLGSLMYRCLSGDSPFRGGDATAMLAKVLLEEPPPLRELDPAIPVAIDELVARMLSKSLDRRPKDGEAVLAELDRLDSRTLAAEPRTALGSEERRVVWIILLGGGPPEDTDTRELSGAEPAPDPDAAFEAIVRRAGGRWAVLADGTGVASFVADRSEREAVVVRCALALSAAAPTRPLAMSMGMAVLGSRAPVGRAVDRAGSTLLRARAGEVSLDTETAKSVDPRYVMGRAGGTARLARSPSEKDSTRRLLGRATRCVGRQRELATLTALLDECIEEPTARAALLVGEAGIGKSRIRYELLRGLSRRDGRVEVLLGRAEALKAGSSFGLLREALRRSAGVLDGEPPERSRQKLGARVLRAFSDARRGREAAAFLGELAHVPAGPEQSASVGVARQDPTTMGDSIRAAWIDFVTAECSRGPLLIVLEDLHWGDQPTVSLIDAALAACADAPLMVLALARPEVRDAFPRLWKDRELHEIRLRPLRRAASQELVRDVLGEDVPDETVQRIIELSEGNAFFLEELIRAVADGQQALPASVVEVVQARLDALAPEARRALRAGSVLGSRFWRGAVSHLLGEKNPAQVDAHLAELVLAELLTERPSAVFPGEAEYAFRHALVEETAYATLTDEDRQLGHRMAAEWLEEKGEVDALSLAEHFRRGGLPARAASFYVRAAEQALEGNDLTATIARAELAIGCAPGRALLGAAKHLQGHAHLWRGEYALAEQVSREAKDLLEPGTPRWFAALSDLASSANSQERAPVVFEATEAALSAVAESDQARTAQIMCLARAIAGHLKQGRNEAARELMAHVESVAQPVEHMRHATDAWIHHARSAVAYYQGDIVRFREELEVAVSNFDAAGDARTACNDRVNLGFVFASGGDYEKAYSALIPALASAERLGLSSVRAYALHNLAPVYAALGDHERALSAQRAAIAAAGEQGEHILEGSARAYLAGTLCERGELAEAEREARLAVERLEPIPSQRPLAYAALSRTLLLAGRHGEALSAARAGMALVSAHGAPEDTESAAWLALAGALRASGELEEARSVISAARSRLLERAALRQSDEDQQRFLTRVPDNARTLALAEELGVTSAGSTRGS